MTMQTWNVRVHTQNGLILLGQVDEVSGVLARCAALSKFGIPDDEDTDPTQPGIRCDDDFDVSPA